MTHFASPEQVVRDKSFLYSVPNQIKQNYFALGGVWKIGAESAIPEKGSYLKVVFNAQIVEANIKNINDTASVKVFVDGKENSTISLDNHKDYKLLELNSSENHILMLEFLDTNSEIFYLIFR